MEIFWSKERILEVYLNIAEFGNGIFGVEAASRYYFKKSAKNLTQSELAEKIGVTDKSISNWENGRNMPDLSLFKPLCEILDISVMD